MPDWITHLGTTYMAGQAAVGVRPGLARRIDLRQVLLGGLLPDATRFSIILVDRLHWPAIPTFTYLIPFHSLLIVALLAGALALVWPTGGRSSRRAFGLLMAGALGHFFLDDIEGGIGCGSTTFYPFYFGKPAGAWAGEGQFALLLPVVAALALGVAVARARPGPPIRLALTRSRLLAALALLGLAAVAPLPFRQHMIDANAYYLGLATRPAAYDGQPVALCYSRVIAVAPPTVEEFDRPFVLQTPEALELGEWVSVSGVYQNGAVRPAVLVRHRGLSDISLSLVAVAVFVIFIFRTGGVSHEYIQRAAWFNRWRPDRRAPGRRRRLPVDDNAG